MIVKKTEKNFNVKENRPPLVQEMKQGLHFSTEM